MEEDWSAFKILTGKPTVKRHLGRPRSRWNDHIRMDIKEIGFNMKNLINSTLDRDYWRSIEPAGSIYHGVS